MANPFSYLARNLLTWEPLDTLPYQAVTFGRILDQHGAWMGQLPLASPKVQRFSWKESTLPSKTALFVDLNGVLVWGGIIWTSNYESTDPSHTLKVGAVEFGSYFTHRIQAKDYSTLWEAGEDPMKVIKRIVEDAQEKEFEGPGYITGEKIPIVLNGDTGESSISVSYPASSLQTIDSINSTLTQMGYGAGYDFSWDVAYLPGTRTPGVTLNLWFPLKGRTAEESGIVILGKDTVKWTYPVDGTQQADAVTETGSGTGGLLPVTASSLPPVTGNHISTESPDGYPLLEKATSRTQITTEELLEKLALGDLALFNYPVPTPSIVLAVPLPGTPAAARANLALGEFDSGDRLIFRIDPIAGGGQNTSPRFPEGMEYEWRINQWTCTPSDKGLSTVQLDVGMPPLGYVPAPAPPL
jgi:hypothetical protein